MKSFKTLKTFSVVVFVFSLQALLLNMQSYNLYAQTTAIPDVNFEQALIDLGIDSDGIVNGQVLTSDIENLVQLNVSSKNISDLTGIEGFTSLVILDVSFNSLVTMNLSDNFNLEVLDCSENVLENINLSNNTLLKELFSGNPGQTIGNQMTSLDLSNNINLEVLHAENLYTLSSLNLKNGNNSILTEVFMLCELEGEPCLLPLTCVEVDDAVAANGNQAPYSSWSIEANFVYSEDCSLSNPDHKNQLFFLFYPNPVVDFLTLETQNCTNCIAKLYSATGKILKTNNLILSHNTIEVKDFKTGLYFIVVENEYGNKQTQKFVKK